VVLAVAVLVLPGGAGAQQVPPAKPAPVGEIATLRLRYGVALRSGQQSDLGPGLTYSGLTPNDAALTGAGWLGGGHFGLALSAQREGFSLLGAGGERITSGSLWRAQAGPTARLGLGPLRLEGQVGYGLAQLPSFGESSVSPAFAAATRHGPVFGARASVQLPFSVRLEARGEYPLALFARDAGGAAAQASGFSAGGALIWDVGHVGTLGYSLVADYQYVRDTLSVGNTVAASQRISRAGLALEFALLDRPPPPPPPRFGGIAVTVVDAESGALLSDARVELLRKGRPVHPDKLRLDAGTLRGQELEPGELIARASAGGYLPGEGVGSVVAGQDGTLRLALKKEPPPVGALAILLLDQQTAAPVANALIKLGGKEYRTGPGGNVTIADLPPGPVALEVVAASYRPLQEVASVVKARTASVPLKLVKEEQKVPATLTGVVRTRGGKPIAATLEIPEAEIRTAASEAGTFTFHIQGGTYTVQISAPGYLTQKKRVTVKDGDQAIFNVDLFPSRR